MSTQSVAGTTVKLDPDRILGGLDETAAGGSASSPSRTPNPGIKLGTKVGVKVGVKVGAKPVAHRIIP